MKKICFVINSQKRGLSKLQEKIRSTFDRSFDITFLYTTGYRTAEQHAQAAVSMGCKILVAVGGDGTVNEVVNGVIQSKAMDIRIAVLPWGTGNDFARTICSSKSVDNLYCQIQNNNISAVDAIKVSFKSSNGKGGSRYFNNVADLGIGPDTLITVAKISKWVGASIAFSIAAVKALFFLKPCEIYLETDEFYYSGKVRCVCIANGKFFGSGLGIAPAADLCDGAMNLVIIEDVTAFDFIKLVGMLRKARQIEHPKVKYISVKRVKIETGEREFPMEVDGEVVGYAPVVAEVLPGRILVYGNIFEPRKESTVVGAERELLK